jgi:hypothetical protein
MNSKSKHFVSASDDVHHGAHLMSTLSVIVQISKEGSKTNNFSGYRNI